LEVFILAITKTGRANFSVDTVDFPAPITLPYMCEKQAHVEFLVTSDQSFTSARKKCNRICTYYVIYVSDFSSSPFEESSRNLVASEISVLARGERGGGLRLGRFNIRGAGGNTIRERRQMK
jgi:hypothetical protein